MNVLVIGSGGREHALCWKLRESKQVRNVYCAPGNPGTADLAENVAISVDRISELADFAAGHDIDLTVVGPEYPLTLGIVDEFRKRGLRIFGPDRAAARIEGSKAFAKEVMQRAAIPTAEFREFRDRDAALTYLAERDQGPIVVKADGLAAGKGVHVCGARSEAEQAVRILFDDEGFDSVVIEEFLEGKEASFIVATDGTRVVPFASSHDYKRIGDDDQGPNTGGMGTVSPTPNLTPEQEAWVLEHVMQAAVDTMREQGNPFSGFLYAGLMIQPNGSIRVLEFNARMGDPECQSILPRLKGDLAELLKVLTDPGKAALPSLHWEAQSAVCVVLAAAGYPASPSKGDEITGTRSAEERGCHVFHAGTSRDQQGRLVTAGGRVLNVVALGSSNEEARERAYGGVAQIRFAGQQFRRDIGKPR